MLQLELASRILLDGLCDIEPDSIDRSYFASEMGRRGKNMQLPLPDLLRQSIYSRLAGCEDVNGLEPMQPATHPRRLPKPLGNGKLLITNFVLTRI